MAIKNYKRAYSITITFKEGYGDAITVESPKSEPIYAGFHAYISGSGSAARGFELVNEDGSACIYLYDAIAKICRTAIKATETEEGKCEDLDVCDLLNKTEGSGDSGNGTGD